MDTLHSVQRLRKSPSISVSRSVEALILTCKLLQSMHGMDTNSMQHATSADAPVSKGHHVCVTERHISLVLLGHHFDQPFDRLGRLQVWLES